jgi:hypothetical protein
MLPTRHRAVLGVAAAVIVMAGCAQKENAELQWARAALERNPQLKVVSVDQTNNTIKARVKLSGEVITLTPGELAAIPIADLVAVPPPAPPPAAEPAPAAFVEPAPATPPIAEEPSAPDPVASAPAYTVQREDGRVRVSGPGVSIETAPRSAKSSVADSPTRYDEPIICDGKRFMHFDNRTLNVDGDAFIARGGCELHITNSRIAATGTALTVMDATVHITNSELTGSEGSLTTSSAARVFLRNNRLTGLARRSPDTQMTDQGGNTWR